METKNKRLTFLHFVRYAWKEGGLTLPKPVPSTEKMEGALKTLNVFTNKHNLTIYISSLS
jgi:hypothetical protein